VARLRGRFCVVDGEAVCSEPGPSAAQETVFKESRDQ